MLCVAAGMQTARQRQPFDVANQICEQDVDIPAIERTVSIQIARGRKRAEIWAAGMREREQIMRVGRVAGTRDDSVAIDRHAAERGADVAGAVGGLENDRGCADRNEDG